jgi:dihydroflavonol-4-reductase
MLVEAKHGRLWFAAPGGTNFVSVDDVVAGHIAAAERGRIGERYILGGENLPFREVFTAANELFGRGAPSIVLPRWIIPVAAAGVSVARTIVGPRLPIDARQMRLSTAEIYADAGKSHNELGVPFTPFRTALRAGYEWYRDNGYLD